jgi:hypothetical protein
MAACLPAFRAILLRPGSTPSEWEPVGQGLLIVTASQEGAMLVNGHELRPRATESGVNVNLLAAVYYPRAVGDDPDAPRRRPEAGDIVGMKIREDLVAAYEVRLAGPGTNSHAEGLLEPDGIACEFRADLGSVHPLVRNRRPSVDTQLH